MSNRGELNRRKHIKFNAHEMKFKRTEQYFCASIRFVRASAYLFFHNKNRSSHAVVVYALQSAVCCHSIRTKGKIQLVGRCAKPNKPSCYIVSVASPIRNSANQKKKVREKKLFIRINFRHCQAYSHNTHTVVYIERHFISITDCNLLLFY